jgi:hypothetical protein
MIFKGVSVVVKQNGKRIESRHFRLVFSMNNACNDNDNGLVTRLTRRMSLVEQELLTLLEHLCLHPFFLWVRVTRSLVLYVCFVDRCLSFCTFSFGHCVVCSSSIYGLWLPLWYLQTLLNQRHANFSWLIKGVSEYNTESLIVDHCDYHASRVPCLVFSVKDLREE